MQEVSPALCWTVEFIPPSRLCQAGWVGGRLDMHLIFSSFHLSFCFSLSLSLSNFSFIKFVLCLYLHSSDSDCISLWVCLSGPLWVSLCLHVIFFISQRLSVSFGTSLKCVPICAHEHVCVFFSFYSIYYYYFIFYYFCIFFITKIHLIITL